MFEEVTHICLEILAPPSEAFGCCQSGCLTACCSATLLFLSICEVLYAGSSENCLKGKGKLRADFSRLSM